jgi:hypothetical protein
MQVKIVERRKGELNLPLIYLFIFLFCFFFLFFLLNSEITLPEIPCIFKLITKHPCPTCGTTRLTKSLINLQFFDAFMFNPMIFVSGILFLIWGFYGFFQLFANKKIVISLNNREWWILRIAIVAIILLNWLYLEIAGI